MNLRLLFAAILSLSLFACSDDEPVKYQLESVTISGSSFEPIVNGIQLAVYFESNGEDMNYELELNEEDGTFSTTGSYVIATEYLNMPMAAIERISYDPNLSGTFSKLQGDYVFDDPFISLDFGMTDLSDFVEGSPTLTTGIDGSLRQAQDFAVKFSANGTIDYNIAIVWKKK